MLTAANERDDPCIQLCDGWMLAVTGAGQAHTPSQIAASDVWITASVPGTATSALRAAGRWTIDKAYSLHDKDIWYRLALQKSGSYRLRFEGLATFAEVWLDDVRIAQSDNMFLPLETDVQLSAHNILHIAFRSLTTQLHLIKGRRARWRTALITESKLRFVRTTLLGHMPGWCPPVDIAGPWRPISLLPMADTGPSGIEVKAKWSVENGGRLEASFALADGRAPVLTCNGYHAKCRLHEGRYTATMELRDITPWSPHTHGEPVLYPVAICDGDRRWELGSTGFRSLEIDGGTDGSDFRFQVNGQPVFMRGVCWTPPDIADISFSEERYRREFDLLREANINMVRISGTMFYESPEFFRLADEYGILVWQDIPLANFDYPLDDPDFVETIRAETAQFACATQMSPSLAVVCGGSEIWQQASMLGLPEAVWKNDTFWKSIEDHTRSLRDNIIFVGNSPSGGALPFHVNAGIGHYYGVGAYNRPLEDARRANVKFASECLAFANVPDAITIDETFGEAPLARSKWKERVPQDRGASWDFEDTREFYMQLLYGVHPSRERSEEPGRYLALARATSAEVMETTFAEWRKPGSRTGGGLVFFWKDLWAGAGWGIVDSQGRPKSAWYALKRAFRPLQLLMSDEGVNGLMLHVLNETTREHRLNLTVSCLREGSIPVAKGEKLLTMQSQATHSIAVTDVLGAFFDANYAYKFGPPAHDVTLTQLTCAHSGKVVAEAVHFPNGRQTDRFDTGLQASVKIDGGKAILTVQCSRFAQTVSIASAAWKPADNFFHLAPGQARQIMLQPIRTGEGNDASLTITALNHIGSLRVAAR